MRARLARDARHRPEGVREVVRQDATSDDPHPIEGSYTMVLSATSPLLATEPGPSPVDLDPDGFHLDVRIVETGPAAAALLGSTDDGCDTVRGSDC